MTGLVIFFLLFSIACQAVTVIYAASTNWYRRCGLLWTLSHHSWQAVDEAMAFQENRPWFIRFTEWTFERQERAAAWVRARRES